MAPDSGDTGQPSPFSSRQPQLAQDGEDTDQPTPDQLADQDVMQKLGISRKRTLNIYGDESPVINKKARPTGTVGTQTDAGVSDERAYIAALSASGSLDYLQPAPPGAGAVKKIRRELEEARCDTSIDGRTGDYIPAKRLYEIMNDKTVGQILEEIVPGERLDTIHLPGYVEKIAPSVLDSSSAQFRRVLALLILIQCNKEYMIFSFVDAGIDDERFYSIDLGGLRDFLKRGSLSSVAPSPTYWAPFLDGNRPWEPAEIRKIIDAMWKLWPPFFSIQRRPSVLGETAESFRLCHYALRSADEQLPFDKSEKKSEVGGFSTVAFYKLHKHQHDFRRYTKKEKEHEIAVKTLDIKKTDHKQPQVFLWEADQECYILDRITLDIMSPHVVKLLATYESPGDTTDTRKYHMMFEASDGTIADLWDPGRSDLDRTNPEFIVWMARQCLGLAQGLGEYHKLTGKREDDPNPKRRGIHGDIKPDNILWYRDWKTNPKEGGDLLHGTQFSSWVLQLGDFGLGSFHSTGSVDDAQLIAGMQSYIAPETEILMSHPPSADIWQLGCLFVEVLVWLVEGPEGLKTFRNGSLTKGLLSGQRYRFSTIFPNSGAVSIAVSRPILEKLSQIYRRPATSKFIRDLADLAINHMLVIQKVSSESKSVHLKSDATYVRGRPAAERMTCSQVVSRLADMISTAEKDKDWSYFGDGAEVPEDFVDFEDQQGREDRQVNMTWSQLQDEGVRIHSGLKSAKLLKVSSF